LTRSDTPPVHEKLPRQPDRQLLFRRLVVLALRFVQGRAPLLDGLVVGLELRQPPGGLDEDVAHARVAVLGNRAAEAPLARRVLARYQPAVAGDLTAVVETVVVATLA